MKFIGRIGIAGVVAVLALSACGGPSKNEQYNDLKGDLKAAGYVDTTVAWSDGTKALGNGEAVTINIEPVALAHTPSQPRTSNRVGGASASKPATAASTGPKTSSTSSPKPSAKKTHKKGSTPELQTTAMLIAGCQITIEREQGESQVMRKIGDRDIEYFEVEVGGVDVENDALPQSPTQAELEAFLRGNTSLYACVA